MDTHWHVGEEIAAAEKEALPEARGSYRLCVLAQAGCYEFDTNGGHIGKVQTPPPFPHPVIAKQISIMHNVLVLVLFRFVSFGLNNKTIALRCTLQYFDNHELFYHTRLYVYTL